MSEKVSVRMGKGPIGILLMAYGTPSSLDEVEAYYTHIRRGRKPTPEALQDLVGRYKAIGGVSPLAKITKETAERLQTYMNQSGLNRSGSNQGTSNQGGSAYKVYLGMKHSRPFIEDAIMQMAEDGVDEAVGLVLAPHYSAMSVGTYIQAAEAALEKYGGPRMIFVKQWYMHPLFLEAVSYRVAEAMEVVSADGGEVCAVFSAHSLPERILEMKDPYPAQLEETAKAIADRLRVKHWTIAWQSAGRTPEPWLGPDILAVLKHLRDEGYRSVVSCPIGFVSDHLEVLYDIDVECQALAKQLGLHLVRSRSLNADADFITALAAIIEERMAGEQ